jgi:hypothetical protein
MYKSFTILVAVAVMLFAGVSFAQDTARMQVIHNSADPAAEYVDVYLWNGTADELVVKLDNFQFRTATPYVDVPAGDSLAVIVADSASTDEETGVITTIPVGALAADETYVVFANGVVGEGFAANPDEVPIGFELLVKAGTREAAEADGVDFFALHGATDAPTVDVIARDVATLVDDAAYTDMTDYVNVPAAAYILDVTPGADNETIVASFEADLSGLDSGAAVVFASGFLVPENNNDGPAFGLFAALPTGDVVEFPVYVPTAALQVIHNSAEIAAAFVDVYLWNGTTDEQLIKLDNFAFRTATAFVDVPAGDSLVAVVADSGSQSVEDGIATIPIGALEENGRYVAIASGVIFPDNYAPNPDAIATDFQLLYYAPMPAEAATDSTVGLVINHGSTDAPTVDVVARGVATLADDLAYTDFENYQEVPAAGYEVDITTSDGETVVVTFGVDLSGLGGDVAMVFASGFLTPESNQDGEAFGLFAALANGDVVTFNPVGETEVLFNVNMSVQILGGNFVEGGEDTLDIRGSFNGWSQNAAYFMDENDLVNDVYELLVTDFFPLNIEQNYKYVITHDASTIWESQPNRTFTVTGSEPDNNGNGIPELILPLVYFSDVGPDQIFVEETEVVFEVDMRPAYNYIAAEGALPIPEGSEATSIDSVFLASGATNTDPEMAWVWDLTPGDPIRAALQMNDDGVDGDGTAGDSIWSITVTFQPGAARTFVWKYGVNGLDNEAGFGTNHSEDLPNFSGFPTIFKIFGEQDTLYDDYQSPSDIEDILGRTPREFSLQQNYPNPFNPSTSIVFTLKQQSDVSVIVYNMLGQKVRTLVNENRKAGAYQVVWNGTNDFGNKVSTGIYFYRLEAGDFVDTKKMVLMK